MPCPCKDCGAKKESPLYRGQRWCISCLNKRRELRKTRSSKNAWERMIYQRYKLRPEDYERFLTEQKGVCAICCTPPPEGKRLAVDHKHNYATLLVRGLLCYRCNSGLVMIETLLTQSLAYLEKCEPLLSQEEEELVGVE